MNELIRDTDQVGYSIGVHIDYKFFKTSDLDWVFYIIKQGIKEVRLQQKDRELIHQKKIPKRLPIVIEYISTNNCIDITILLTVINGETIVSYGALMFLIYNYIKEKSKEKRYVGKRYNLERIKMRRIRRTIIGNQLKEEVEDEFVLEF